MVIRMSDPIYQVKTDILFKGLSALVLPLLAYVLSLSSDLGRNDQRLRQLEKEASLLVKQIKDTNNDLASAKTTLAEIKVTLQFIRKAVEK
jgi:septal ring factor EnvC (AmiA/AmiB activator)